MSRSDASGEAPGAIDRLAASMAADLLASVIEDSRRAAAELLRARLTAALVEQAEDLAAPVAAPTPPVGTPSPTAPAARTSAAGQGPAGWYVYGLTRPSPSRPVTGTGLAGTGVAGTGVDGAAVQAFEHCGIVALVSAVPAGRGDGSPLWGLDPGGDVDLEALAPRLQAHERVLEEALARAAVLPFRFGVMYRDRDTVERVIEAHAAAVRAELDRLEGRAEWGVALHRSGRAPAPLHSPTGTGPAGRDYLTQRRDQRSTAARWDEEAAEVAVSLHDRLADLADEAVTHRPDAGSRKGGRCLMRASYLIRASRIGDFRRAADEMLSEAPAHLGLSGELTGPWPPYHFIDVDLGDSAPAGNDLAAEVPIEGDLHAGQVDR